MKTLLLFVFSIAFLFPAQAALVHPGGDANTTEIEEFSKPILTLDDLRTMRNRDIRDHLGRRVSLGESLAFSLIRGKLKRQDRRQARRERRNARRAERGLPPIESEVDRTVSSLALGSLALFVILTIAGAMSALSGATAILWFFSLIGSLVFGGSGRRQYRGVDNGAFNISTVAFWTGLICLTVLLILLVGLVDWLS